MSWASSFAPHEFQFYFIALLDSCLQCLAAVRAERSNHVALCEQRCWKGRTGGNWHPRLGESLLISDQIRKILHIVFNVDENRSLPALLITEYLDCDSAPLVQN